MDAPPVQYVTTSDGYKIAYAVRGQGLPVIFLPHRWSHIQLSWQPDILGDWWQGLSARFQLVLYDPRGVGMSTRGLRDDHAIEHYQRDLIAVIDRLGLDRFVLFGSAQGAHVAVQYALEHPENVIALVLMHPGITLGVWKAPALYDALPAQNWDIFVSSLTETPAEQEFVRQSISPRDWLLGTREFNRSNIEAALPRVRQPTLVLHAKNNTRLAIEESMRAAHLANAQMALIDGRQPMGDAETGVRAIESFLADLPEARRASRAIPDGLSPREVDVLRLVAAGKSNPQIAGELVISLNTVQRHVSNIFGKIGVANRTEAAGYARDRNLY